MTSMTTTKPQIIILDECDSTNSAMAAMAHTSPHATVLAANRQRAGRGQRGNTWEAAPGANLTFSLLLKPDSLRAIEQFRLSQAVALGIVDTIRPLLPTTRTVRVKWPNDIYVDDMKICGILIENSIVGQHIAHSIAGIGLNVNQRQFLSTAPNPVSLTQLTGITYDLRPLLESLIDAILTRLDQPHDRLHDTYFRLLWRAGAMRCRDISSGREYTAEAVEVAPTGHITVRDLSSGHLHTYAFKEVAQLL